MNSFGMRINGTTGIKIRVKLAPCQLTIDGFHCCKLNDPMALFRT